LWEEAGQKMKNSQVLSQNRAGFFLSSEFSQEFGREEFVFEQLCGWAWLNCSLLIPAAIDGRGSRISLLTIHFPSANPEQARASGVSEGASKDPENTSFPMPHQDVFTNAFSCPGRRHAANNRRQNENFRQRTP